MLTAAPFDRHMPINRGMTYEQMLDAVETQPVHVIKLRLMMTLQASTVRLSRP